MKKDLDRRKEEMDKGGSGEGGGPWDTDVEKMDKKQLWGHIQGLDQAIADLENTIEDPSQWSGPDDPEREEWNRKAQEWKKEARELEKKYRGMPNEAPAAEGTGGESLALPYDDSSVDEDSLTELKHFMGEGGEIYQQKILPMIKNVQRKMKSGEYDHSKAPKLWNYAVEEAAKKYTKEMGSPGDKPADLGFTKDTRRKLANALADDYRDSIEAGDYD